MAAGDNLIALEVKAGLLANNKIGQLDIHVDVHGSVAILSGEVDTEEQKQIAEEVALQIEGISSVDNEIVVASPHEDIEAEAEKIGHLGYGVLEGNASDTLYGIGASYVPPGSGFPASEQFPGEYTDEQVMLEVKKRLEEQDAVDVSRLGVVVDNQIAYLSGTVKTVDDLNQLQDIVMNVRGVMGLDMDELKIEEGDIGTPAD